MSMYEVRVEAFCEGCAKCIKKDMFGQMTVLECGRSGLVVEPDGFCKWAERRSEP